MNKESKLYVVEHCGFAGAALEMGLRQRGYQNLVLRTEDELALTDSAAVAAFFSLEEPEGVFIPLFEYAAGTPEHSGHQFMILANVLEQAHRAGVSRVVFMTNCLDGIGEAGIHLCRDYTERYGVHYVAAVSDVLYGMPDAHRDGDDVYEMVRCMHEAKLQELKELVLPGAARQERDFLYIQDMVSACIYLMQAYEDVKPLYVDSGHPCSWQHAAELAVKVTGYAGRVVFDGRAAGRRQPAEVPTDFNHMSGGAGVDLRRGISALYQGYREKHIRISACVIMRDSEQDIAKCLESLQDSVDEMIVVDTGSQDDSLVAAGRFTDKVFSYPWQDDFSAAKNFALEQATGDWVVFLDADEYFTESTRKNLRPVCASSWGTECDMIHTRLNNIDEDQADRIIDQVLVIRIFRRDPQLRYHDRIHEYLAFEDGHLRCIMDLPETVLLLNHTGYSSSRMARKSRRNLRMLRRELKHPEEKQLLYYYLAGVYFHEEDFSQAMKCAKKSIERKEVSGTDEFAPYRLWFHSAHRLKNEKEKLRALKRGLKAFPTIPDFYAEYGVVLYNKGKKQDALPYFLKTEQFFLDFNKNNPHEYNKIGPVMPVIYGLIAEILEEQGDKERAALYQEKAAAKEKSVD